MRARARGEAATPAAHNTVRAAMRVDRAATPCAALESSVTPSMSTAVTRSPVCTSTPSRLITSDAFADSPSG